MKRASAARVLRIETPRAAEAARRSRMYTLLAEALSYPTGDLLERLRDGTLARELRDAASRLATPVEIPASLGRVARDPGTLQVDYTRLFDACGARPAVSMLEHRYAARDEPPQPVWEDLLRCYRFFGLDFAHGGLTDSPDHLLLELEFMHYLTFLEAGARHGQDDLRRGQRDFLATHPARWVGGFASAVARHAGDGPYAALARLLHDFVALDLAYLNASFGAVDNDERRAPTT